jgi:hypothetical protein
VHATRQQMAAACDAMPQPPAAKVQRSTRSRPLNAPTHAVLPASWCRRRTGIPVQPLLRQKTLRTQHATPCVLLRRRRARLAGLRCSHFRLVGDKPEETALMA